MESVFVGKIVNTHGIKGELRIKSDFEMKEKVFQVGKFLMINKRFYEIASYRVHKGFDMVTFTEFNNINQVLPFKGLNVYVNRDSLNLEEEDYILDDLIGMAIYLDEEYFGEVIDYTTGLNPLIEVSIDNKKYFIPLNGNFIQNIDVVNKQITANDNVKQVIL